MYLLQIRYAQFKKSGRWRALLCISYFCRGRTILVSSAFELTLAAVILLSVGSSIRKNSGTGAVLLNSLRFMLDKRKKHDDEEDGDEDNIEVHSKGKL